MLRTYKNVTFNLLMINGTRLHLSLHLSMPSRLVLQIHINIITFSWNYPENKAQLHSPSEGLAIEARKHPIWASLHVRILTNQAEDSMIWARWRSDLPRQGMVTCEALDQRRLKASYD